MCVRLTKQKYRAKKSSSFITFIHLQPYKLSLKTMTGIIKALTDKGFGFIAIEGQDKDLFFHSNSLVDVQFNELREGDTLSFETEMSPKGMNAINVHRI